MGRLALVVLLVLAVAVGYRSFGSAETATGTLTLAQPAPNVGQEAANFTAETRGGETFRVFDEGIYVLAFWSTLNESTDHARPSFTRLAREYGDEVSFAAVYVSSAPEEDGDVPYTVLQDSTGRLASRYNVKRVPRLFLIQDGEIALVQDGYYEENKGLLEEVLRDLLTEKNAAPG